MTNVAADDGPDEPDVTAYAVHDWGRTARLCAIRMAEAVPAALPVVVWWILRR